MVAKAAFRPAEQTPPFLRSRNQSLGWALLPPPLVLVWLALAPFVALHRGVFHILGRGFVLMGLLQGSEQREGTRGPQRSHVSALPMELRPCL